MIALVIENPLDKTGVGRYTSYLIEVFDGNGIDYQILDYTCSLVHSKARHISYWYRKASYLLVWCGIRDFIPIGKYELLIFPTASPLAVLLRGNKVVAVHDLMHKFYKFPEVSRLDIRFYRDRLYNSLAKAMVTIVVDSEVGVEHWIRFYKHCRKIRPIPFYASLVKDNFKQSNLIREKELDNYLFYPAAFWSHKNHINLVRAIKHLVSNTDLKFKVVFCGKPNVMLGRIEVLINALNLDDYFEIFDFISDDDLIELYVNSKGLIYPSYFGPTNIPPLEAISLEVPIAVANVFEPKNIYGEGILTFDPNDIKEISEACRLLLSSEKDYLGNINNKKERFFESWMGLINEN